MNRSKLNIGTYHLAPYASTEAHVSELAECGIDIVVNMRCDRKTLDLFDKYGVGAVITGVLPGWFGGDGSNAGTMSQMNPLEKYEAAITDLADHPAVWGIDTGDEPSALDFSHYGNIFACIRKRFTKQFPYLNIYPSYGVKGSNTPEEIQAQLRMQDYAQYIEAYCKNVEADYICFDYYLYSADIRGLYESLRVVSDACIQTGRSMWMVLQVNSHQAEKWISTNQLRFQAYAALAFGAKVIIWACYTAGWWYNHVLDKQGNKTRQYDKLKEVNAELHKIGSEYMKYDHTGTYFVGGFSEEELGDSFTASEELCTEHFSDIKASCGQKLLIGVRKACDGSGKEALMICAADDPYDKENQTYRITFRTTTASVCVMGRAGNIPVSKQENEMYSFEIRSCEGVLITEQ